MGRKAPIFAKEEVNIYKLLRLHGVSDAQLEVFIETMLMELKILAGFAELPDVVNHLEAAIKACSAMRKSDA